MPRSCSLVLVCLWAAASLSAADNQAVWKEYGLVQSRTGQAGKTSYTAYQMKDLTGALAAWEWQRPNDGRTCDLGVSCTTNGKQTVVFTDNYLLSFNGPKPGTSQFAAVVEGLPDKASTSLPAILTFVPKEGLVPNSGRYILGPESLQAFAPDLASVKVGFEQGAEAQIGDYQMQGSGRAVQLAVFYYPTPEMARLHTVDFKLVPNVHVKRSGVLLGVVSGQATDAQADTLLSRLRYEAKITWNDVPPPSPIKPMYSLLMNIVYMSILLAGIGLTGGLMYGGMRLYRRKYGNLEAEEAMTTLHLSGD